MKLAPEITPMQKCDLYIVVANKASVKKSIKFRSRRKLVAWPRSGRYFQWFFSRIGWSRPLFMRSTIGVKNWPSNRMSPQKWSSAVLFREVKDLRFCAPLHCNTDASQKPKMYRKNKAEVDNVKK